MADNAAGEFRRSWRIVLGGWIGAIFGQNGFAYASFSVLAEPLARAFGQTLPKISLWVMCYFLGGTVASPIIGLLSDRIGARKVILWSTPGFGLIWLVASVMHPVIGELYALGFVAGAIAVGASPLVYGRVINTWFTAGRGTALGIMSSGIGLSYFFGPFIVQRVIDAHGWRSGYLVFAAVCLLPWTLSLLWLHERREVAPAKRASNGFETGYTVKAALKLPAFWLMGAAMVAYGISASGVTFGLTPFLSASGLTRAQAVWFTGLLGIFSVSGRLITGFLIDRIHAATVCGVILVIEAAAFCTLGGFGARYAGVAIAATGFAFGGEVCCIGYLVSRYFGVKYYGGILGLLSIVASLGVAGGPPFFSFIQQSSGGYTASFLASAAVAGSAALCFGVLRMHPYYPAPASVTD